MAKRRRKKPNIPEATLEQVRQEADAPATAAASDPDSSSKETSQIAKAPTAKATTNGAPRSRRKGRDLQAAQLKKGKADKGLDAEYVADRLANPTKVVTEEQLQEDYGFVIQDLRNMGILAAVLFVALIGIALVIL